MGQVEVRWLGSELMVGADSQGHTLVIGSGADREPIWEGLKPSDLLLLSAAACSAYDVAMILRKQREPLAGLEVACSGTQQAEPPFIFTAIHMHYVVRGPVDERKLARAISLSEEKYCSVVNTLRPVVKVTSSHEILA